MTSHRHGIRHRKPVWLPLIAVVFCIFTGGIGTARSGDDEHSDTRERFVELDGEIQAIKEEILDINREILQLEEMLLYPNGQQVVVLVSVDNDAPVKPGSISLWLDGKSVSHHTYTGTEVAALQEGGVHRLYTGRLIDGEHTLEVSVAGKQNGGRDFQHRRSVVITKKPGQKYLEVNLRQDEDPSEPGLSIREW